MSWFLPTPGPLLMAGILGVDLGTMILVGLLVALPTAVVGLAACHFLNRRVPVECRPLTGEPEADPLDDSELPSLGFSLLPILLPVVLISAGTVTKTFRPESPAATVAELVGNVNLALLLAAAASMIILVPPAWPDAGPTCANHGNRLGQRRPDHPDYRGRRRLPERCSKRPAWGDTVRHYAGEGQHASGILLLLLAGVTASVVKMAQGSSTVAMIATAGMFASSQTTPETLGFHPVYLAMGHQHRFPDRFLDERQRFLDLQPNGRLDRMGNTKDLEPNPGYHRAGGLQLHAAPGMADAAGSRGLIR